MDLLLEITKQFGIMAGLVVVFIWRDVKRERGLVRRVREVEDKLESVLVGLVTESTMATQAATLAAKTATTALEKVANVLGDLASSLRGRRCIGEQTLAGLERTRDEVRNANSG